MNFDFLKDLRALGHIQEYCNSAEKLAKSMPLQSIFTSRKSAEALAKFIYLAAYNEEVEFLTFDEILRDKKVIDFIGNNFLLNSFHFIRKNGNKAVHGDDSKTPEEAIEVLEKLHYVIGQTAVKLKLVDNYPPFNGDIAYYPEAKYLDEETTQELIQQMFKEYLEKHDAQLERDHYYQNNINNLINNFEEMESNVHIVPGMSELVDVFEFKQKPKYDNSIMPIQAYFAFLGMRALKKTNGELNDTLKNYEIHFDGELTIYGENGYTTSNLEEFINGILYDLPLAEGFKIKSHYSGPSIDNWYEANSNERKDDFKQEIENINIEENFEYSFFEFMENRGEISYGKYENGEWIDIEKRYTSDILDKEFETHWWCFNLDLFIKFDFKKHSDILEKLRNCIRERIPKDQIEYCENAWEDDELETLWSDITWYPKKLREVQDCLDEFNSILKPIMKECDASCLAKWYIVDSIIAVAECEWTNGGFTIKGTTL